MRRPDGGDFFNKNGLLFLPDDEVKTTTEQMIQASPFLGPMAADPSLRGIMTSLQTALMGVERGQAKLADLDRPMQAFGDSARPRSRPARQTFLSWRSLVTGATVGRTRDAATSSKCSRSSTSARWSRARTRRDAIRAAAASLHLTPENGVRVRLTGPGAAVGRGVRDAGRPRRADGRGDDAGGAGDPVAGGALVQDHRLHPGRRCSSGWRSRWRSASPCGAVFNIISIAFVALFVGIGVDFGIQFCVRYRHERFVVHDLQQALICAGRSVGTPLALAAAATAAGFFSFLPTSYVGVAELGLVAGIGMIVAFVLSITLLPALLMLISPVGEEDEIGYRFFAPVDRDHDRAPRPRAGRSRRGGRRARLW